MVLSMIAAIGKNYELGKDNDLIWHLPSDLKFFKETTKGHTMVMGRKTFESLPGVLPNRHHIVISRSNPSLPKEVEVLKDMDTFFEKYKDTDEEIFVVGGASIYSQFLPYADKLILTEIDKDYDADVFFPTFDKSQYTRQVIADVNEKDTFYQHVIYTKK